MSHLSIVLRGVQLGGLEPPIVESNSDFSIVPAPVWGNGLEHLCLELGIRGIYHWVVWTI
jgi:hypothetical protein